MRAFIIHADLIREYSFRRPLYVFKMFTVKTTSGKRRRYFYGNHFLESALFGGKRH